MITDLPTQRIKRYHSDKHLSKSTRWWQKNQLAQILNEITSLSAYVYAERAGVTRS